MDFMAGMFRGSGWEFGDGSPEEIGEGGGELVGLEVGGRAGDEGMGGKS